MNKREKYRLLLLLILTVFINSFSYSQPDTICEKGIKLAEDTTGEGDMVFLIVEKPPEYPGGKLALRRYIYDHLTYPSIALENGISGTVYLQFVVMWDGSIGKIKVLHGVDPMLENEAIRVVKLLPRFKPGYIDAKPVSVWYSASIQFGF